MIAGGGVAGLIHGASAALRAGSTAATGGLGNFLVAKAEFAGGRFIAVLAIPAPLIALAVILVACVVVLRLLRRLFRPAAPKAEAEIDSLACGPF